MAALSIAIYRMPTASATQVGSIKVVRDRHRQLYLGGSKVIAATPEGAFMALTLASGQEYYVKLADYDQLIAEPAEPPPKKGRRR